MGAEDGNGFAALDEERFVVIEASQRLDDRVERLPRTRGTSRSTVNDEFVGAFRDLGIEIIHQHTESGFLRPPFAGYGGAARRADVTTEGLHDGARATSQRLRAEG